MLNDHFEIYAFKKREYRFSYCALYYILKYTYVFISITTTEKILHTGHTDGQLKSN